jgi:CheY-like chemotaxis protein
MANPGTKSTLEGRRVLVIEDEILVAMELESVLRRQGCTVLGPVPTVDRALALIEGGQIDAALLDLNLDGQSALPVAAALNARDLPFVVVSGYSEARSQAPELRHASRLAKPVDHPKLLRELARLLKIAPR